MKRLPFNIARARFVHRYTMEHVPQWARMPFGDGGKFPAPHFTGDREWYENTVFPGERGLHGNCKHCITSNLTWPLGRAPLDKPLA